MNITVLGAGNMGSASVKPLHPRRTRDEHRTDLAAGDVTQRRSIGSDTMNTVFQRLVATDTRWGPLALRIPVGIIFAAHGAQKLFGWFGGYGLEGTGQWMASIGLHPGTVMALLAGSAELFGGIALIVGLFVRPAAAVLAFNMLVAIVTVHLGNGLFASHNGYELALALLAAAVSLTFNGGGRASLDRVLAGQGT
jgi:putative oxidoreductase